MKATSALKHGTEYWVPSITGYPAKTEYWGSDPDDDEVNLQNGLVYTNEADALKASKEIRAKLGFTA